MGITDDVPGHNCGSFGYLEDAAEAWNKRPLPTIEKDREAGAIHARFSAEPVARTEPLKTDGVIITADFDAHERLIGIKVIEAEYP